MTILHFMLCWLGVIHSIVFDFWPGIKIPVWLSDQPLSATPCPIDPSVVPGYLTELNIRVSQKKQNSDFFFETPNWT